MKMSTLLTAALAGASVHAAVVRPEQVKRSLDWTATNFSINSTDNGPTKYLLIVNGEGQRATCFSVNSVDSSQCPGANGPASFTNTACEGEVESPFYWSFENSTSPTYEGGPVYFVKITYQDSTGTELVGCSPEFQASNYTCTGPPGNGETLNVPSSFSLTEGYDGQCLYL